MKKTITSSKVTRWDSGAWIVLLAAVTILTGINPMVSVGKLSHFC